MKKTIIVIMGLCFFATNLSAQSQTEYYPLVGDSVRVLSCTGHPTIIQKNLGTEIINKKEYFKFSSGDGNMEVFFHMRCEGNRVYKLTPLRKEELKFDFNTDVNEPWVVTTAYSDGSEGKRTGRIIGRDMTVKVPAGIYEGCIVYELTEVRTSRGRMRTTIYTYWLAPETGLIKMSVNMGDGSFEPRKLVVYDLSSYTLTGE